jgi:Xaa-Pro aminopeptidase
LSALLKARSLDSLLVRKRQNILYLTGTRGEDSILFVSRDKNSLVTDTRYKEEYNTFAKNCTIKVREDKNLYAEIGDIAKKIQARHIGFEANSFAYSEYTYLKKSLKKKALVPTKDLIESLRMIKDKDEIRCIKRACKDACEVMDYALKEIRPFLSEKSLKAKIEAYIAGKGLKRADFEIIIASGKNASMPHAISSVKRIKKGEMVIIDLGILNSGYNSDLTRTVFSDRIEHKSSEIYNIVSEAQRIAIENIRPGVQSNYIDNISREYITKKGLGKYFIHSLGHGIGLETHERPAISRNNNTILQENMVITVEPGIYIQGWGGVRIEDVVLVTKGGCEVLTNGNRN